MPVMNLRSFENLSPQLGKRVYVDPASTVIGDVHIGDESSVWPGTVVRGDIHRIRIGARTSIQDGSVLHVTHAGPYNPDGYPLTIGDDVTLGHQVMLHGCTLGDRILIGMQSIVLDGAHIGNEVVLGAGSLVPPGKNLESGFLYLGRPAKKVRELSDSEREYFLYTAQKYVELSGRYLDQVTATD